MFGKKKQVKVRVKVAGFIDRRMITEEFDFEAPEKTSVKKLFGLIDKSGPIKGGVMRRMLGLPKPPAILINGDGIDLPGGLGRSIGEGDEISIMTPMGGG